MPQSSAIGPGVWDKLRQQPTANPPGTAGLEIQPVLTALR